MMIRFFDIFLSVLAGLILSPLLLIIYISIRFSSGGPVLFAQTRVGKGERDFTLYKFRTMRVNAEQERSLTIGSRDSRITTVGYYLRKMKLDELPQLWNVLKGDMSIAGPRPELRKYVEMYTQEQKRVLKVKPGITDFASIEFKNESDLLASANDSETYYIQEVIPIKIRLNDRYLSQPTLRVYFLLIFKTVFSVFRK